jgi:hypothetical protein
MPDSVYAPVHSDERSDPDAVVDLRRRYACRAQLGTGHDSVCRSCDPRQSSLDGAPLCRHWRKREQRSSFAPVLTDLSGGVRDADPLLP